MALRTNVEVDPISQADKIEISPGRVRRGTRMNSYDRPNMYRLLYSHGQPRCGNEHVDDNGSRWSCSRPAGHPAHWKHVAASDYEIYDVWGGGPVPASEFVDPPDGTPDDPADVTVTPELGGLYRLRDRRNILQVVDGVTVRRPDGWLDVLDLNRRQHRAVPASEMVPTDYVPTREDVAWIVQYSQKLRENTRDEAIRLHHQNYWCRDGLQETLADLGLPAYVPVQRGTLTIEIPYTANLDTTTSTVKALLSGAINTAFESIKTATVPSNNENVTPRFGEAEIHVRNVSRS